MANLLTRLEVSDCVQTLDIEKKNPVQLQLKHPIFCIGMARADTLIQYWFQFLSKFHAFL